PALLSANDPPGQSVGPRVPAVQQVFVENSALYPAPFLTPLSNLPKEREAAPDSNPQDPGWPPRHCCRRLTCASRAEEQARRPPGSVFLPQRSVSFLGSSRVSMVHCHHRHQLRRSGWEPCFLRSMPAYRLREHLRGQPWVRRRPPQFSLRVHSCRQLSASSPPALHRQSFCPECR